MRSDEDPGQMAISFRPRARGSLRSCTVSRQSYTPRLSFKQGHPEVDLQLLDPLRHRPPRQVENFCRALQVALRRDDRENPQRVEIEVFHDGFASR